MRITKGIKLYAVIDFLNVYKGSIDGKTGYVRLRLLKKWKYNQMKEGTTRMFARFIFPSSF